MKSWVSKNLSNTVLVWVVNIPVLMLALHTMSLSPSRPERVALHLRSDRLLKADSAIIISNNLKMSCDAIKKHNYVWTISKLPKKQVWNRLTLSKWTPNQRTRLSMCKGTSPLTSCPFTVLFPGPFLSINCPFPKLKSADLNKEAIKEIQQWSQYSVECKIVRVICECVLSL